jgi:hypothetical protein
MRDDGSRLRVSNPKGGRRCAAKTQDYLMTMKCMLARHVVRQWILCGPLMLVACGGGGGGGTGGGNAPNPVNVLAADAGVYWPTSAPTKHFRGVDSRVPAALTAEGYANVEIWTGGGSARSVAETNSLNDAADSTTPTTSNFTVAADGVHDLTGGFLVDDVLVLRSPVVAGDRYTVVDKTVSVPDRDGDGRAESAQIRVDVEVMGIDAVSVPAGRFANAVKVVTTANLQITASRAGIQPPVVLKGTDWLVAQLGRVKTVFVDGTAPPGLGSTVTEELAGYRDGTRAFGAFAARPLFETPLKSKSPPAIASSGGIALVAASTSDNLVNRTIEIDGPVMGALVGSDGSPGRTLTLIQSAIHGGFTPAIVADGNGGFVVVAGNRLGLLAQRVAADGSVRDGRSGVEIYRSTTSFVLTPTLSRIGNRLLLAWAERSDSAQVIKAMLLDAANGKPVSSPVTVSALTGDAGFPRLATAGQEWLLVFSAWSDRQNYSQARAYPATLHAVRLNGAGAVLDAVPRAISQTDTAHSVADVSFDGTDYVVAWADNRDHLGAPHGGVFPPEDAYTSTYRQDVFVTRLLPSSGQVAVGMPATGLAITTISAYRDSPGLAVIGTRMFEVHNVFRTNASDGIYYRWLDRPLSATAAQQADNRDAIDNIPTYGRWDGAYGQTVTAAHGAGALVAFLGAVGATGYPEVRMTFILPPAP